MGRLELAVLGLACCLAVVSTAKLGVVHMEGGFVEGVNKKLGLLGIGGRSVDIFKGIPFAAPPKALENPQRHPGWQGTLKAKDFKQRCMQVILTQQNTRGSEDCLYLNIWVPQGQKEVSQNMPVMIWIYGGAFLFGSGQGFNFFSDYLYDGEEIATRGNVIVVTFNYRLGPLGFLSTGDAHLPGNYGLRDQHMAITWVKRNIAAFGGGPRQHHHLWGISRGASINLQTLSPYSKDLIRRAISQSGMALVPWAIQKNPLSWAKGIAKKVGCPLDDTARMAKCLKVTDPRELTLAYKIPLLGLEDPIVHYLGLLPVVDGDFIPDDPINLFANAADIDYIAGTNNMDGHIFAFVDMPAVNVDNQTVTGEDFLKLIRGFTLAKGPRGANATFDLYTASWAQDSSQEAKKKTVVDLETDVLFLMPMKMAVAQHRASAKLKGTEHGMMFSVMGLELANIQNNSGLPAAIWSTPSKNKKSARTYTYLFSHPTRIPLLPSWVGADHTTDLQYVFGKPFTNPLIYRPQDRTVSLAMIAYWTNFARTGDPNKGHSAVPTQWDPYTQENGNYLEINKKMDGKSLKQHLRSNYLQYWTQTYQALPIVTVDGPPPYPAEMTLGRPVTPAGDSEGAQMSAVIGVYCPCPRGHKEPTSRPRSS